MKDFAGKIAVITGGGTGMGRGLARPRTAAGCRVAMCDVSTSNMAATKALCEAAAPQGVRVSTHLADVSHPAQIKRFAEEAAAAQDADHIHLLFNNAGIGGGGSFVAGDVENWEKTFNVCWGGVYHCTRAFLPLLMAANEAHIVNTSSVNGFWASIGPGIPHTAYAAAKFAVKGFTEALITDLAVNAPHIHCSVVMPGHIGTEIITNSRKILSGESSDDITPAAIAAARGRMSALGLDGAAASDAAVEAFLTRQARAFHDDAPMTAAQAAAVILDGVRSNSWRILVGADAHLIDRRVRADPEHAYDREFFEGFAREAGWKLGV
jgi:NAD(P)-dependent dehydrogenase (short-subunit alcohol dehydrogenase family)